MIFRASGHVDRFADLMTKDVKTGECFRLDHLIKAHLEKLSADKKATAELKATCQDIIIKVNNYLYFLIINILNIKTNYHFYCSLMA